MDILGRKITREETLKGSGVVAGAAALVTALALWGDKPLITVGISVHGNCDPNLPYIPNTNAVLSPLGEGETKLIGIVNDPSAPPAQRAIAKADLQMFTESKNSSEVIFKDLSANELTCKVEGKDGKEHLVPSDEAETMASRLRAAGVEISFVRN